MLWRFRSESHFTDSAWRSNYRRRLKHFYSTSLTPAKLRDEQSWWLLRNRCRFDDVSGCLRGEHLETKGVGTRVESHPLHSFIFWLSSIHIFRILSLEKLCFRLSSYPVLTFHNDVHFHFFINHPQRKVGPSDIDKKS